MSNMLRGFYWLVILAQAAYPCSCLFQEPLCKTLAQPDARLTADPAAPVFVGKVIYSYPGSLEEFWKRQEQFAAAHPDLRPANGPLLTFEGTKRFLLELWGDKASPTLRQHILAVPEETRPNYADPLSFLQALSHVEVIEPFGGIEKGTVIELVGGLAGDCSVHFRPGESYLVFPHKRQGFWTTSICDGSTPISRAQAELRALRGLRDGKPFPPFLYGSVVDFTNRGAC